MSELENYLSEGAHKSVADGALILRRAMTVSHTDCHRHYRGLELFGHYFRRQKLHQF